MGARMVAIEAKALAMLTGEHLKQLQYYTMAHFQVGPWLLREFPSRERERFPNRPTVAGVFASRTFCPESAKTS
jgi:hypothetical protein